MTESLPRGNFGPGPAAVPSISWFEFLLDDSLLETHLKLENPDPSPYQLIIQFLQQADSHLAASTPDKPPTTQIAVNGETVKDETTNQDNKIPVKENRKVTALKLLALKVAAFLHWNLAKLMKSVPLVMIHSLLNDLCRRTMDCDLEAVYNSSIDFPSLSPQAAFTLQLYHRFCILSVIKDSFPVRPVKSFVQMQGQVDPMIALAGANDLLVRNIRERITMSVVNLEKCVECGKSIIMPSLQCIDLPKEDSDGLDIRWEEGITISPHEYNCQLYYDLGCFYFYQEAYSQAYVMFQRTKELLSELESPTYCNIDASRLNGYYTGCRSLQGVSDMSVVNMETTYEQAEAARKNNYQGLVELLIEDNLKQELSTMYRSDIEDEIANQGDRYNVLYIQVSICNVIRGVMEGKALVSLLANVLEDCDKETTDFLLMVLWKAFEGASNQQKSNLKCFIWHLIDLSSPGSKFPALVINGDLKDYFTEDELNEMELFTNDDNSTATYTDMFDDATTVCSSFPTSRDSSVVMGNTEYQLIHMYDTDVIRHLVVELCQNRNRPPSYAMSLNEKWRVPKEMHQILFNMQPSCDQAYVYILIGKACHCMDVRIYERARHMLAVADAVVAEMSYTLSKHVRWYILLADLQQYFLNEMLGDSVSLQDLVKKTKTCITSVRLGQDIQPSHEVLEHCAAFLMNIRDWAYLSNLENTANGHIELCLLVSSLLKELASVKNSRKLARDVWEAVVNIFSSAAHRRINTGRGSAFSRDPQLAVLSKEEFREFLKKLKEPTALSIFVSLLTKLYNILRDDISCEISSDYVALWPSALVNANTIHPSSIDETVLMLMQHVLQVNPAHPSWLRTQADILFANGQYSPAMKYYMEAGVVASDFFSSAVPKSIYDDQVYRRMIKCCSYLQCYTQVAVLCQFLDETDYTTAFKSLQERNSYDAMDAYYNCIWDISILEFLVHLHAKRGEMEKRQAAMRVLSQLDLNSNNPEDIVQRAVQMRKRKFLRSLAKQYL